MKRLILSGLIAWLFNELRFSRKEVLSNYYMFVLNMLIGIKKIKKISTVLFFMTTCLSWSQHTIKGQIKDASNLEIAYANLLLLKAQDSTITTGTSTNDHGFFTFENIAPGKYMIKASFIGYSDTFTNVDVSGNVDLPTIIMQESAEALNEVEIVVKKPTLKREADRLVFNIEKTALSEGNMMEVLRSTPSVIVLDDNLQVKGSAPTVYINDRKVHLSASELVELLEGTSASNIKSVEVITNPSSRYDAESGVVLNIVMSKNLVTGYNGSAFTNYTQGVFPKMNYGMSHYYKTSKVNLFFNYSYRKSKTNREDEEIVNYPGEVWKNNADKNFWSETHNLGLNFDYDLNDKNRIAIAGNAQFLPYFKYVNRSQTNINPIVNDISRFDAFSLSRDKRHNIGVDFDFVHKFSEQSKLMFNTHYTNYDYYRKQNVSSDYFNSSNSFFLNTRFRTRSDIDTNIFTSQLDFSTTLSENSSLDAGVKFSNVQTESGINHFDIINNQSNLNEDNSNTFDYDEDVFAGYINFETRMKKFSINAGIRAEQTNIEGISSNGENNKQDYLEWFPNASVAYQLSEKVGLHVTYKRSLQRPNYSQLNPFVFYINDNSIITGNPDLRPIFTNVYKIGTTINNMFTIEMYYKKYENNIFELPLQNNLENTITYTPININTTEEIGFDIEAYFDITKRWSFYFGNSIYNYNDKATLNGIEEQRDKWANYSIMQNDWSFLKDNSLTASLTILYVGANVQGLQLVDTRWDTFLSVKKTILKGKGILSLSVSDLLNEQDFFVTTNLTDQNSSLYTNLDNRYVRVGFRYKFGNTRLSTNQRSTSKEERDRLTQTTN